MLQRYCLRRLPASLHPSITRPETERIQTAMSALKGHIASPSIEAENLEVNGEDQFQRKPNFGHIWVLTPTRCTVIGG